MQLILNAELEHLIKRKVDSGDYASASEVVREALQLLDAYDYLQKRRVEDLGRKIDEGIAQLDRGEGIAGEESRQRLKAGVGTRAPRP
jgi:antitoxin ParD1/3/4